MIASNHPLRSHSCRKRLSNRTGTIKTHFNSGCGKHEPDYGIRLHLQMSQYIEVNRSVAILSRSNCAAAQNSCASLRFVAVNSEMAGSQKPSDWHVEQIF